MTHPRLVLGGRATDAELAREAMHRLVDAAEQLATDRRAEVNPDDVRRELLEHIQVYRHEWHAVVRERQPSSPLHVDWWRSFNEPRAALPLFARKEAQVR